MIRKYIGNAITVSAQLLILGTFAATAAAHTVTPAEGDIEASGAYIGAGGNVVKTGMGECLHSSAFSSDTSVGACEGSAEEAPKEEVAEAPAAQPAAQPQGTVETRTLSGIGLFGHDSDQLTGAGMAAVEKLLGELGEYKGVLGMNVVGHTDSTGSEAYNQGLSERRAETVRAMMATRFPGVPVTASGMGESSPVASNDTAEGRQANRRVEISVEASRMVFN